MYRSILEPFLPFIPPHPLFPLSFRSTPEYGSKRCVFRALCSQTEFSSVHKKKGVQEMAISFHGIVSHAAHVDGPFPNIFQVCMALSTIRYFNIDTLSVFTGRRERLGEQSVHICTSFTLGDCTRLSVLRRLAKWSNRDGRTTLTGLARSRFR